MNIRKFFSDSNTLMRIGVTSLIVELFSQLYLHPNSFISGNAVDGVKVFLSGFPSPATCLQFPSASATVRAVSLTDGCCALARHIGCGAS
jgi:hypothetical protein